MTNAILWLVTMQAVTIAPPPVYVPSHTYPLSTPRGPFRSVTFDVEVRGGNQLLWSGAMRVSTDAGASIDRRQSDAPAERCPSAERGYGSSERDALSLSLSMRDSTAMVVAVRGSWERRVDGGACEGGTRTISFSDTVPIAPGSVTMIKGDGGLTVTLRQR
ncbi:hypothetical protein [uncultured Sphingomonas sp.]|uniref:hypothetical protein n=1 Tax=uncultured Sphingomonas sp. TaxID=158754 RepID=UPI00374942DF